MNTSSDLSLLDRWTHWLAQDAPRRLAPATVQEYRRHVIAFAGWMQDTLGVSFQPDSITAYRVEQYACLLERQVTRKTRKPATYNKLVAALSSFGAWLVDTGLAADNPARRLRAMAEQLGPPKALEKDIIGKLLDAAHHTGDLRDALIIELLAHSGMRASEVAAIQLTDLEVGLRTTWLQILGKVLSDTRICR